MTNVGADVRGPITAPYGPAVLAVNPAIGASRRDTSISHVQFATPMGQAVKDYGATCSGPDPSETKLGLAEWFRATLLAIDKEKLSRPDLHQGVRSPSRPRGRGSATRSCRSPTRSPADGGGIASSDRTNRVSVALAPPHDGKPPPIAVYVIDDPHGEAAKKGHEEKKPGAKHKESARDHAVRDPTLQNLLLRKAPIKLQP